MWRLVTSAGVVLAAVAVLVAGNEAGRADAGDASLTLAEPVPSASASAEPSPAAGTPRPTASATPSAGASRSALRPWGLERSLDEVQATDADDTPARAADRARCEQTVPSGDYANGELPDAALCRLWDPRFELRADAGAALWRMNEAYRNQTGQDLCLADAYRSLSGQREVAVERPGYAATPGRSQHGWGLAVDFCGGVASGGGAYGWLTAYADEFGWGHPVWAQRGGSGPYEPWHWEYFAGQSAQDQLERAGRIVN